MTQARLREIRNVVEIYSIYGNKRVSEELLCECVNWIQEQEDNLASVTKSLRGILNGEGPTEGDHVALLLAEGCLEGKTFAQMTGLEEK